MSKQQWLSDKPWPAEALGHSRPSHLPEKRSHVLPLEVMVTSVAVLGVPEV